MAGPWNPSNPPVRPGGYVNWRAITQPTIQPNLASIVCVPFTHNWGPLGVSVLSRSWAEWQQAFGSDDTPGSRAVKQCFFGEGLPGYGGAGAVLSYRIGTTTGTPAAFATLTLNKTGPAAALVLTAKYRGTRANRLNVTVRTNAQDSTAQDLVIYDTQTVAEVYTFLSAPTDGTPMADLAAFVNRFSGLVTASVTVDGSTLLNVANAPLAGGADGATLVAGDWTAALSTVQSERFSIFAPYDCTDTSIQASITAWIQGLNNTGKRVNGFFGGALNEIASTAITRATATNEPNIDTVGVGGVVDFGCVGTPQVPVILSTSQLAPRIAGIFASRGGIKPLTFARLAGCDFRFTTPTGVVSAHTATDTDVVQCLAGGVIPITRDSNPAAPLRLEKGVTTWQKASGDADPDRPYAIYKNPKFLKIMQDFEMAIVEFSEREVITPGLPMTQATREFVLGRANQILRTMNSGGLIQSGYSIEFDKTVPASPTDDFLTLDYQWYFTRSVEQVRNQITVG